MKNLTKLWSLALLLTAAMFMVSCEEDEPTIDVTEGLNVADGYYFVVDGEDPVAEKALLPEKVEGEGNVPTDREGFFGNYVFLEAGDYQIQKVESKEVSSTLGGALSKVAVEDLVNADEEPFDSYQIGLLESEGEAVNIANDGFFKISYDETTTELIVMEVKKVSFIGAPSGWSDVELDVVSSNPEDGFVFETGGVEIRQGDMYKLRINNAWKIIRNNEAENGYVAFTNYGGTADALVAGGDDIPFAKEDGIYTINVELQNDGGAFVEFTKTGEAEEITFDPAEYNFGILGSTNANAFDSDRDMVFKEVNGHPTWHGVVYFAENSIDDQGRRFKFRTNDDWAFNLGGVVTVGETTTLSVGGSDIEAPAAGAYYFMLWTEDEGETWQVTTKQPGWSLIGEGSPSGNWDDETPLVAQGFDENGVTTYTYSGDFAGGAYKLRAGSAWDYNLGGSLSELSPDGSDLSIDAGNYTFTLTFDGSSYSATVE
ncbi:hypothetical protein MATR_16390 [Marivirga tractuosa]|uniref:SusE outer membrane protein domain-containing protein n=1 Tax=Marivirga tractuosa (strain ATCC 23168 / DSM 4126 / NBRC 15989 / NCIMB 1408 / VKM B-1430 / H-43) TaxID=643867 RepID=E4TRY4_MARTH|nr:hypothetical protein [Marivirga tractuosa]ADR20735.1 hypothetical protein Ftrac_0733 [Marivirga tractuosa DSM 4126]BDD14814.1 hypothetical protein MATR_16390 [Marivirga tractuosa]